MFTIALSTLCISAGVTASLYLALPNLNFMSSKVPDMFKPNLNGTGDFKDGNMIVKVHIQSLRTPYRRLCNGPSKLQKDRLSLYRPDTNIC